MINFFNKRFFILFLFPIFLGGLSVLSFEPFNLFYLNFLLLPSLFWLILYVKKKSKSTYRKKPFIKNLFYLGTSFGFGYFFFGLYWIVNAMTFDESFKIFIPFGLFLIPIFLSLFFSLPIILTGSFIEEKPSSILVISFFFGLSDFIRSIIFNGFPWNIWIYSFSSSIENVQLINNLGFFSLNLIFITFFFSPSLIFFKKPNRFVSLSLILILIFSNYFYGSFKINNEKIDFGNNQKKINFKVVTAGIELSEFKDPIKVTSRLIKLSEPNKEKKTIFVWPEGIFVGESFSSIKLNQKVRELFKKNFSKNHLIIFGSNTSKITHKEMYFNSMILVDNNLNIISQYDKKKLVPFGEFIPMENILNKFGLKKITPGYSSYSSGISSPIIEINFHGNKFNFLPLICYEIIFPSIVQENLSNFNFIINISEDAWFGETIGPHQHFAKAVFRAIESKKFLVRSANKGKTVFIDPNGKIIKSLEPNEAGNIELEIPALKPLNNKYKKSLIFFLLLITYVLTFFVLRKLKF